MEEPGGALRFGGSCDVLFVEYVVNEGWFPWVGAA
jgi:hypothetical protein